ncbi:MAG: class IV adenylate cyclase [Isosphaeraceae bacterium]
MGFEIENKYRVADREPIRLRLIEAKAQAAATVEQADHYLSHPDRDFAKTDEALRIRRLGDEHRVTYKGPKRGGVAKTREEVEIACESGLEGFGKLARVFEALGFRPVAVVHKSRDTFHLRRDGLNFEIALNRVRGIGEFVEIETLARDETEFHVAQSLVADLAVEFGLRDLESRSYLRMTLEMSNPESPPVGNPSSST